MVWRASRPLSADRMPMLDTGVGLSAGAVSTVPDTETGAPRDTGTAWAASLMTRVWPGGGAACSGCATMNGTAQTASRAITETAILFMASSFNRFVTRRRNAERSEVFLWIL